MEGVIHGLGLTEGELRHQGDQADHVSSKKKRKAVGAETADSGNPSCEPCDKTFTTRRSYLRHMREEKRHRTGGGNSEGCFKCPWCPVTCGRAYDLRRHETKKHSKRPLTCESCGTRYKPGTHSQAECAIWRQPRDSAVGIVNSAASAIGYLNSSDLSVSVFETQLLSATQALGTRFSSESATVNNTTTMQPSTSSSNQLQIAEVGKPDSVEQQKRPTCGHCHRKFGNTQMEVEKHLARHGSELNQWYTCGQCDFSFVRECDLLYHQKRASDSYCGFKFEHVCSGHHPPSCSNREAFCRRVRNWEQSQLQLFSRSVTACARHLRSTVTVPFKKASIPRRQKDGGPVSVPSQVDYHTRMDEMMADFSTLNVETHQYKAHTTTTFPAAPLPPHRVAEGPSKYHRQRRRNFARGPMHPPAPDSWQPNGFASPYLPCVSQSFCQTSFLSSVGSRHESSRRRSSSPPTQHRPRHSHSRHLANQLLDATRDKNNQTLLHELAHANNFRAISVLLDAGVYKDGVDINGRTALHVACRLGNTAAAEVLIRSGILLNEVDVDRYTPMHYAVLTGNDCILRTLLSEGADANPRDENGHTPLYLALNLGNNRAVRALRSHGTAMWPTNDQSNISSYLAPFSGDVGPGPQFAFTRGVRS